MLFSNEAIQYQVGSPFGRAIAALMQKCLDIVASKQTRNEKLATYGKIKEVLDVELPHIVFEHTGIVLECVVSKTPDGHFGINPIVGNELTTIIAEERYAGNRLDEFEIGLAADYYGQFVRDQRWVDGMVQRLNLKTGKFIGGTKEMPTSKRGRSRAPVRGILYFDPYYAFMPRETYHVKIEPWTAEEAAAICLHEIGHVLGTLEHASQMYAVFDELYNAALQIAKGGPTPEKFVKIRAMFQQQEPAKTDKTNQRRFAAVNRILNAMIDWHKKPVDEPLMLNTGETIILHVISLAMTTLFLPIWLTRLFTTNVDSIMDDMTTIKNRDTARATNDAFVIERYADQYVSQHGFSSHLASGLLKRHDHDPFSGGTDPGSVHYSSLAYYALKATYVWYSVMIMHYPQGEMHGDLKERLHEMRRDIIRNLASCGLDDVQVADLIADLDRLERVIDQRHNDHLYLRVISALDSFYTFIGDNFSVGTLISLLRNGNLMYEYTRLKRSVQDLIANPLFATAARIKMLD